MAHGLMMDIILKDSFIHLSFNWQNNLVTRSFNCFSGAFSRITKVLQRNCLSILTTSCLFWLIFSFLTFETHSWGKKRSGAFDRITWSSCFKDKKTLNRPIYENWTTSASEKLQNCYWSMLWWDWWANSGWQDQKWTFSLNVEAKMDKKSLKGSEIYNCWGTLRYNWKLRNNFL